MISLEATVRNNTTKGQLSAIRNNGNVPAIIYGGKGENEKILISKKILKSTIEKENFLSILILTPGTTLKKSTWIGSSVKTS